MSFDRAELEEMKERWLAANIEAEKAGGDWKPLAEFYTEDATYGWNYGPPKKDFMAVGRDEIRDLALGQEMEGLEGWEYPYQSWVIDETTGDMIGLWKQVNEGTATTAVTMRSRAFRAAGSSTAATSSSPGSGTSSTTATSPPVHRDDEEQRDERRDAQAGREGGAGKSAGGVVRLR